MEAHRNNKADKLWNTVVEPFLHNYVFPPEVDESFISLNEALKYGIMGRVANNDGYKLCVEDVLASIVVAFPQKYEHIKAYRANYIEVACRLVEEVKRRAQKSFMNPALHSQKDIIAKGGEYGALALFDDYNKAFKRYFLLFNEKLGVTTLQIYFPSENGCVEYLRPYIIEINISSKSETSDGLFLKGYEYYILSEKNPVHVVDVVANNGKNYFATYKESIEGFKGKLHIWRS